MAAQRIWFLNAPAAGISGADRAQLGIGYGGLTIGAPAVVSVKGARKFVRGEFIPCAVRSSEVQRVGKEVQRVGKAVRTE